MSPLFFANALLPDGWHSNVSVGINADGMIESVASDCEPPATIDGQIALPGMPNLHSHAFQRAMAGLGEWAGSRDDSFWSWREVMYRFVGKLRPQDLQAIAAQLYVEMLQAGYTSVAEFHYLHHQADGTAYDDPAEMARRIVSASDQAGIGLTLLPVWYQYGGFGSAALSDPQRRFANDADHYAALVQACIKIARAHNHIQVGVAPHSLRAVPADFAKHLAAFSDRPHHIHIAEQLAEVAQCVAWSGKRPVEWLLDNVPLEQHWCLVHATHMLEHETQALAASGAVAGLCPSTEANLGDGTFDGVNYAAYRGRWGIGSDSHIRVDVAEELRSYEYSQRLRDLGRNRLARTGQATGRALFDAALAGGTQASGRRIGTIATGYRCDLVALDADHALLANAANPISNSDADPRDNYLNAWIFAGDGRCVRDVWVGGEHQVQAGQHRDGEKIDAAFHETMRFLTSGE